MQAACLKRKCKNLFSVLNDFDVLTENKKKFSVPKLKIIFLFKIENEKSLLLF